MVLLLINVSVLLLLDYHVEVKTGDDYFAGTDATVKIRVQGTEGTLPERQLNGYFERGR